MTVTAVITAAGYGTRLGSTTPKALVPVGQRPLLVWALEHVIPVADAVVVTAPHDFVFDMRHAIEHADADWGEVPIDVIAGGQTRQQSVALALDHIFAADGAHPEVILVHDAARAFMPTAVMQAAVAVVREGADGAVPVVPVVDTLVAHQDDALGPVVDRDGFRAVQTPQVFRARALRDAHERGAATEATDDATLAREFGYSVVAVEGHRWGFKVTHPEDLAFAEHLVHRRHADQGGT